MELKINLIKMNPVCRHKTAFEQNFTVFSPTKPEVEKKNPSPVSVFHLMLSYKLRRVRFVHHTDMLRRLIALCHSLTAPNNKSESFSPSDPH